MSAMFAADRGVIARSMSAFFLHDGRTDSWQRSEILEMTSVRRMNGPEREKSSASAQSRTTRERKGCASGGGGGFAPPFLTLGR
ncbi:hypothetical protein BCR44DRAFT_1431638 [Catenaria anguillulae PL171]|uniref:Uncharacterized protein n=1 Tax=Catenaria anguillulae PL171 TaxID=765915 RepID=A0A1Y2HSL1_9FUNG|nr:hypothetical protein BCR44DRAFT_1431638 [Catenaria anguillulae PL171]